LKKVTTLLPPGAFSFLFKTVGGFSIFPIVRFDSTGVSSKLFSLTTAEDGITEECRDCIGDCLGTEEVLEDCPKIDEVLDEEILTAVDFPEDCPTRDDLDNVEDDLEDTTLAGLYTTVLATFGCTFREVSLFIFSRRGCEAGFFFGRNDRGAVELFREVSFFLLIKRGLADEVIEEDCPKIDEVLDEEILTAVDFTEDACLTMEDLEDGLEDTTLTGLSTSVWVIVWRTFEEVSCLLFTRSSG